MAAAAGTAGLGIGNVGQARYLDPGGEDGIYLPYRKELEETSIAELQAAMETGRYTARQLVRMYLQRIQALDVHGPGLKSIIEVNPDALAIARARDRERAAGAVRGPLHGVPIVIKDNIDTSDNMLTTAGSLALVDSKPLQDATVVAKLRAAGAVILGKTNLSEWANMRGYNASSGWSARGGQTRNPYVIDRNPCGSSSGSGTAVSASMAAASLGTETNGSIVCPSSATGVVGIKPTVGLTSRAGVIPISHTQDTIGPMARTVADAAAVLTAITGVDSRDEATSDAEGNTAEGNTAEDYTRFLDPNGLAGARIGVARQMFGWSTEADHVVLGTLDAIREAGAEIVDPVSFPNFGAIEMSGAENQVLLFEFKPDLNAYLETRGPGSPRTLAELIEFNRQHADIELRWFGQEYMVLSEAQGSLTAPAYFEALATSRDGSRASMDATFAEYEVDAIIAPTGSPAWPIDLSHGDRFLGSSSSHAARAGYPLINVPAGDVHGLPVGITFMGPAWSEGTLIRIASGFEAIVAARRAPHYIWTLDV